MTIKKLKLKKRKKEKIKKKFLLFYEDFFLLNDSFQSYRE